MRTRLVSFAVFLSLGLSMLGAQSQFQYDEEFGWSSPEIMAQGGSYTAIAQGFQSLMTNPAGFAYTINEKKIRTKNHLGDSVTTIQGNDMVTIYEEDEVIERVRYEDRGEVTILGTTPWLIADISSLFNFFFSREINLESLISHLIEQTKNNDVGAGLQFGGGYVGHGFGFGLIGTMNGLIPKPQYITGIEGTITATLAFVGGYSHQFNLGTMNLSVGVDVRPMWRMKLTDLNFNTALSLLSDGDVLSALDKSILLSGWGIGFDIGAIAKWNILSFGVSLRDIAHTRYQYNHIDLSNINISPFSGTSYSGLPYITPMTLRLGIGVHPDFGVANKIVAFKAHAEFEIPLIDATIVEGFIMQSFWSRLNFGAEVKLYDIFSFRGGLSGGYLTAGLGFDLFVFELNASLYAQEAGAYAGSNPQTGAALEMVFRF